jgi:predicted permease
MIASFARGMSDGIATSRFRAILVIGEVALSVFLLVGATLLLASLSQLQRTSPGFDPSGLAAAIVSLPAEQAPAGERQSRFFLDVVERLTANKQVTGAAAVFGLPFHDDNYASPYAIFGRPILPVSDRARAGLRIVTDDYFSVMRMRLLQGRFFADSDRAGAPNVCVINESLARHQFGSRSPLGQVMLRGREADQAFAIIGVVADVKTNGLQSVAPDEIFYSFRQVPRATAAIVARTAADPDTLGPVMQAAVADVDPHVPISRFASMDRRLRGTLGTERLMASLASAFAGLALLLAAVGLYAVLAHHVAARTIEIGIRMAMGADRRAIEGLIITQALRLVAIGTAIGLATAAIASPALIVQLYGVSPYDPGTYGLVTAVFIGVGLCASWVPARRAARVDPLASLNAA